MNDDAAATERPLREAIAEEIKVLMVRRNVSRVQLADALGISHTTIWRRLSGETPLDVNELEVIARTLEVDVLDLFPAETAEPTTVAPVGPKVLTRTRRGRRLTGSYPGAGHSATPVQPPGRAATARQHRPHSPTRPPNRRDHPDDDRPVRLSRPGTPKRSRRAPGDGVL